MIATVLNSAGKASVMALLLLGVVAVSPATAQEKDMTPIPMISGVEMLKIGQTAPDFAIKDLQGKEYNLSAVLKEKKGVFLWFWSIFCEPCKEELPVLQELALAYQEKGFDFVGVILDGLPMKEAVNAFVKQEKYTFRTLMDETNEDESFKVADPFGVAGTPTLYLIDSKRVIRFSAVGRTTKEKLEEALKQLP